MVEEEAKEGIEENKIINKIKKPNWKRIWMLILIISVIALVIIIALILKNPSVEQEMLDITYSVEFEDNTIIDSGSDTFVAGSLAFYFGFNTNKLDEEINSMVIGEEKIITLTAEDAYGEYDETLVFTYNRTETLDRNSELDRKQTLTIDEFVQVFNEQPIVDKTYSAPNLLWDYKVLDKTDTEVILSIETVIGEEFPSGFFTSKVMSITEDKIILRLEGDDTTVPSPNGDIEIKFTSNTVYFTITPIIGQTVEFQDVPIAIVNDMDDDYLYLDANIPFAGETIIIKISLNDRYIKTITGPGSGAPTMDFFIMSYCPYGLQMLKGVIPVWEEFQNTANIELRFVGYTMHGQEEEDENYRMICIREEQNTKLIPYLKCFVEDGDYQTCLIQVGIDETKLDTCMTSNAENYFKEDQLLNEQYSVSGSPTTVINGEVIEIWPRSPENIKTILCEFFTTKPGECSQTLSEDNPSPGFGWGTSNQGGSC